MLAPIFEVTCASAGKSSEDFWAVGVVSAETCPVKMSRIPQSSVEPDSLRSVHSATIVAPANVHAAAAAAVASAVASAVLVAAALAYVAAAVVAT